MTRVLGEVAVDAVAFENPTGCRMTIPVTFYSYFRDLTGVPRVEVEVPMGATLGALHERLIQLHPRLGEMRKSTLIAVGVEYQDPGYVLRAGDEVSLFPPVQGG